MSRFLYIVLYTYMARNTNKKLLYRNYFKRIIDIIISAICLILFSPLFILCSILIYHEDGTPIIFSQERIGKGGNPFYILKFRTMRPNCEQLGPQLSNLENDPRLTRTGKWLRVHHLDELPQLWNVFIGDMSFIGYRPERKFFIEKILEHDSRYSMLYDIRPGVTSYATLYNGYTDTMEKMLVRLDLDLYYLKKISFSFDIKILWLTFYHIILGKKF